MIYETREGPYAVLVSLNAAGAAFGTAYVDNGISFPPVPKPRPHVPSCRGHVQDRERGWNEIQQKLDMITILGIHKPSQVPLRGQTVQEWT
ncbi:hypothetical protein AZE42_07303 [Rhizopogon vesiculosus]|uniref:Uncharacterized protein n=1 Tax=Rhizopogon vesiculosus TaxID=180088 RepID=A0A1J8QNC2_9AGAM|nr:hypothetical protein AZE42_07303 [Rhizopogon vesiculosus]